MPRYGVATFLNLKEHDKLERACKKLGLSKYKLLRKACMKYCDNCLKPKSDENGEERTSENDSGAERGRQEPLKVIY